MKKAWIILVCIFCLLALGAPRASAGSFSMLASTGVLQLSNNQAWEKEYKTELGKFKIRFRKLWTQSVQKKYHLIIWWNDERIADGYSPSSSYGYGFKIFQDQNTKRIFVALETKSRIVLMGYDTEAKRLQKYADSKEYYSPVGNPKLSIDKDKDLLLSFVGNGRGYPTEYKLFWDEGKKWFGYQDVTVHPDVPESEYEPEYTPEYVPAYEPEYEEPQYRGTQQDRIEEDYTATGELFYDEEEIVTGS